jgi:class 3 adenylate cyclase/tetratricopeptide (TPR) repeat protein
MHCGALLAVVTSAVPGLTPPNDVASANRVARYAMSAAALEGERKRVTVLFADLKSSLEQIAGRDPEDARRVLDAVLGLMMDAVHHFDGTVNQVMGDGIMALFGAPLAHEDHAIRACYAALRMQESIERYARSADRSGADRLCIRVGVNSGEVVVRAIDSDLHTDYSAVGETTHVAARLEQAADPGTILVSAHTARLADGYVDIAAMGPLAIKGLPAPMLVYRLTGSRRIHSRLQVAAYRGFTPFVGRAEALATLQHAMQLAGGGHGQLVAASGEPGVGKSRLVWEFLKQPRAEGWLVLEASALPYRVDHVLLTALVRALLGLEDADPQSIVCEKVDAVLRETPAARAPLLALLDVAGEDAEWSALDAESRRRRVLDAVKHLVLDQSRARPVCVVVEDLQWADVETLAVLDGLVTALPGSRVLMIATYRPEFDHAWNRRSDYRQLTVDVLSPVDADRLLQALVGDDADLAPLRALLTERTEGNPFFLEESVRNLIESGVLVGEQGAYRLIGPPRPAIPDTVQSVLAARIDRLAPNDKRVLETASAIGRDVALPLLRAVADVSEESLDESLEHLRVGEFLYETRVSPEPALMFKHALTLDVVYAALVRDRRRSLDAAILNAMERLYPDRNASILDRLAHHALRGELWPRAVAYCREAGARAFTRSAYPAAAAYFERALTALARLPENHETLEQAIDVRLDLRYSLGPLAEYRRMHEVLTEAEAMAGKLGDTRRLARISAFLCNYFTLAGKLDLAVEHGERARTLGEHVDDVPAAAVTHAVLATAYYSKGEYRRAVDAGASNVELLIGELERERFGMMHLTSVYSRAIMTWSLAEVGEFDRAAVLAREALGIAEAADHPHSVAVALLGLGTLALRRGELAVAIETLERARTVGESLGLVALLLEVTGPLASAYVHAGQAARAIALLERVIADPMAARHAFGRLLRTAGLAEAYLHAERAHEALPLAQAFLDSVRSVRARGLEARAALLVAECAAGLDRPDAVRAEGALDSARALAAELGMRPLVARCHLVRAGLLSRMQGRGAAAADAAAAVELFRAMGMEHWQSQAKQLAAP